MNRGHAPILTPPVRHWECPSCGHQESAVPMGAVESKLHPCPKLGGLMVMLVQVDNNHGLDRLRGPRHVVREREDYIGDEIGVRHDADGTAVMAVELERADGSNDTAVFPATGYSRPRE